MVFIWFYWAFLLHFGCCCSFFIFLFDLFLIVEIFIFLLL